MPGLSARKADVRQGGAEIRLERVASNVYAITLTGYFVGPDAERLIAEVEPLLAGDARPHLYFDTEPLAGYRSEFRERMTEWYGQRKEAFGSFNAFVRSKVVSMAIAIANMATGGRIRTFADRAQFERSRREAARS